MKQHKTLTAHFAALAKAEKRLADLDAKHRAKIADL